MNIVWQQYLLLFPLVFLAGFVDSVAGGGGLISLPAYYMIGLSPIVAAGTNKLSASIGTVVSSIRYLKGHSVDLAVALVAALMAFPGSWLGTNVLKAIPENGVRIMMLLVIPVVGVVVLRKKELKAAIELPAKAKLPVAGLIGLVMGFYDGMVGPGTGTFLILMLTMLLGMDGVKASGTAKLVNLASNTASLINLLLSGSVLVSLGIPAAACAMAGNWVGSGMTMKRGTGFIRKMMLVVMALLLAKMLFDVIQ